MTVEKRNLSEETVEAIVGSMYGVETPQIMVIRRLRETGVFCYLKPYDKPLPKLSEDSGLKVESGGVVFDFGQNGGMIDSFIVYDPRRIELKIRTTDVSDLSNQGLRQGRKSRVTNEHRIEDQGEGWVTPFHGSRGRVVSYRPIPQEGQL